MKKTIEKIKNSKLIMIPLKIIKLVLYIFVVSLLLTIIVQKVTNNNISVGGFRIFTIVSESMKGEYDIGDMIVTKNFKAEDLKIGDNVTYLGEVGTLKNKVITHKIIDIKKNKDEYRITTKGIANIIPDPEIGYSQIYGKVICKLAILSKLSKLMNNKSIFYALFMTVGIIISYQIVSSRMEDEEEENEE